MTPTYSKYETRVLSLLLPQIIRIISLVRTVRIYIYIYVVGAGEMVYILFEIVYSGYLRVRDRRQRRLARRLRHWDAWVSAETEGAIFNTMAAEAAKLNKPNIAAC